MLSAGIDLVYLPKMKKLLEDEGFVSKVFHKSEMRKFSVGHLAGVFAAKEAFFKALHEKKPWLDVEVIQDENGRPKLRLSNEIQKKLKDAVLEVSISHEHEYAIAQVIIFERS